MVDRRPLRETANAEVVLDVIINEGISAENLAPA